MSEEKAQPESGKDLAIVKITKYLDAEIVKARFAETIGARNVGSYISSVMITVKDSPNLLACSPASIYTSALRAASLRLSVDPSLGQAYLIPFKGTATLVVGYKGLYDMAVRTGKYRYINVGPIYEGQTVEENPITGFHSITGGRVGDTVKGWIGAFEMMPERGMSVGFGKTMYMTVDEIHTHAQQYSKGYGTPNKDGIPVDKWGKPTIWHTEKHKMERKTVLRLLIRRWGYLNPADSQSLEEAESENPTIDAEASDVYSVPTVPDWNEDEEKPKRSEAEIMGQMGFGGGE